MTSRITYTAGASHAWKIPKYIHIRESAVVAVQQYHMQQIIYNITVVLVFHSFSRFLNIV
jgi:hypothetical protein